MNFVMTDTSEVGEIPLLSLEESPSIEKTNLFMKLLPGTD